LSIKKILLPDRAENSQDFAGALDAADQGVRFEFSPPPFARGPASRVYVEILTGDKIVGRAVISEPPASDPQRVEPLRSLVPLDVFREGGKTERKHIVRVGDVMHVIRIGCVRQQRLLIEVEEARIIGKHLTDENAHEEALS